MEKPIALITGGSRGIGFGIASELAKNGFDLAINGVRDQKNAKANLEKLQQHEAKVVYLQGDISKTADRNTILQGMKEHFGKINLLVNNAGVAPKTRNDVFEITEDEYDYVVNVNERGTFFLTQIFAQWMAELRNDNPNDPMTIINVTSVSAVLASTLRMAYCMSKAGASMMSKTMAVKMAEFKIPVYEIRPGFMDTDMIEAVREHYQELAKSGSTLEPRIGKPKDVGKVVSALATGQIPYATGQIINVDGGLTLERM
ncbi:3-ketoacyl-ACP reductase [Algoriphagus sediminis]|uniref:3-ketoacyl-ACP reductase n=1 Tax=Algoriphagus sediminis TaxID=3057113 RepID=A0ABT7YAJ8_9BACT|nr:3-ketoacyl-ACP reductase [Algoriphagus sediminis]MDN3203547.1 3-ketoacyl-ACP reductase [Algoriphagus sediminis]